jgi:hypothetical protein
MSEPCTLTSDRISAHSVELRLHVPAPYAHIKGVCTLARGRIDALSVMLRLHASTIFAGTSGACTHFAPVASRCGFGCSLSPSRL